MPWRWQRQYRAYRRLEPLWHQLSTVIPEIVLSPVGVSRPWNVDIRLYRRVIEIRDAQLLLEPLADQEAVAQAEADARHRGLTGDHAQAYVDAVTLVTALAHWQSDKPGSPPRAVPEKATGDASLTRDVRYLELVARAFLPLAHSAPVRTPSPAGPPRSPGTG